MKPITKRRIIDFCVLEICFLALYFAGAGLWAMLVAPLALWNYYDGATRSKLAAINAKGTTP